MSAAPSFVRIGLHFDGRVTTVLCQLPHGGLLCEQLRAAPEPLAEQAPGERAQAALAAARRLSMSSGWPPPQELEVTYASTASTAALLYRQLPRVVLLASEGFTDVLRIGRQSSVATGRSEPGWAEPGAPAALPEDPSALGSIVPTLAVPERLAADGTVLTPLSPEALDSLREQVQASQAQAAAVMLLHSPRNGQHEEQVAQALAALELPVVLSASALPIVGEFERAAAAVLAAVGAVAQHAEAAGLQSAPGPVRTRRVQGDGSVRREPPPLRGLLSDIASGLVGAHKVAAALAVPRCITLGVGDLVSAAAYFDGTLALTSTSQLAGLPLPVPVVSAALRPLGGETWLSPPASGLPWVPTTEVKDAAVDAARLWDAALVAGQTWGPAQHPAELDAGRAQKRLSALGVARQQSAQEAASAVLSAVTAQLVDAVWAVSVQRGRDPAELPLLAYGPVVGAVAVGVAAQLGITTVILPPAAGCLTAYGALTAPVLYERVCHLGLEASGAQQRGTLESVLRMLNEELGQELAAEGLLAGAAPLGLHWSADLRYAGQSHCLTLTGLGEGGPPQDPAADLVVRFHKEHERRYGFTIAERPVEIERVRMRAGVATFVPGFSQLAQLAQSAESRPPSAELPHGVILYTALQVASPVAGPVVIYEESAPLFVPDGWTAQRDQQGAVWLRRQP